MTIQEVQEMMGKIRESLAGRVEEAVPVVEALGPNHSMFNRAADFILAGLAKAEALGYRDGAQMGNGEWEGLIARSALLLRGVAGRLQDVVGATGEEAIMPSGIDPVELETALSEMVHIVAALSFAQGKLKASVEAS